MQIKDEKNLSFD